ncbi:AAA family ATPase [Spirochaeta isovalerica]|uniref:Flagellar biosynthesis protein FlhG n=1 Tax=Spirochaeta isovalerica TaxID=150 RepID=A0A841R998_9SPIO|nr:AAA family ATPase [Spirochaeta isovalerica]MBB6479042.1 flagellar biosynthesis protein FlhG [Spirochaeta isovalerica]
MKQIIPVASGKGGVGKTTTVANLGISLARKGKTVIMIDLDLGESNLHTVMGIKNIKPGLGHFINKREDSFESLIQETGFERLYLITGDSLFPGAANLPYFQKKKIIKSIRELTADYILLDIGSGSSYNVIDFFLISPENIIVTIPETTALLNAYSFLKNALYRLIYLALPPHSEERDYFNEFSRESIEKGENNLSNLVKVIGSFSEELSGRISHSLTQFSPHVIFNMSLNDDEKFITDKLIKITDKNLGKKIRTAGQIPWVNEMRRSSIIMKPYLQLYENSVYENAMNHLVSYIEENFKFRFN